MNGKRGNRERNQAKQVWNAETRRDGGRAEWIFAPVVIVSDNAMVKARMDGTAQIQVEAGE